MKKKKKVARGDNKYAVKDEMYDQKMEKKQMTTSRVPGIADAIKKAKKTRTSKLPKVKPQRKK